MRFAFVAAVVASLCLACGPQELDATTSAAASDSSSSSALSTETQVSFTGDWNVTRSNLLVKGQTVRVSYDASRLPQCRGDQNGHPAWSITGYYSLNGGPVKSFEAGGYSPSGGTAQPVFALDQSGDLAMWFQITNVWGCSAWDSKYGANYHFQVNEQPTIVFKKDWTTQVKGTPGSMPTVTIDYDIARVPSCRQTYNGMPTWDVLVYYRFDGGAVQNAPVTAVNGYDRYGAPATLTIPTGAKQLEVWFMSSDRTGCHQWDSAYGANYKFAVN